jgi:hypothetical protein
LLALHNVLIYYSSYVFSTVSQTDPVVTIIMTFLRRSTPLLIAASAILLLLVLASSSAPGKFDNMILMVSCSYSPILIITTKTSIRPTSHLTNPLSTFFLFQFLTVSAEQERILKKKNKKNKLPKASKSPAGKGKGSAIITIQPSTEPSTVPSESPTENPDPCFLALVTECGGAFTCGEDCFFGMSACCGPLGAPGISATCDAGAFFFGACIETEAWEGAAERVVTMVDGWEGKRKKKKKGQGFDL